MIPVSVYANQKVGVFGLGKAGEAAVASLLAGGAEVYVWDDDKKGIEKIAAQYAQAKTVSFNEWPWKEMKALVLSPGVPLTHPKPHAVAALAHQHHVPVIGDIELLTHACPQARIVAITGTNGKSTTTTLIAHILKTAGLSIQVGGNLGTAALSLASLDSNGIYVLELSSYQLDLLKTARFDVAVLLNITPDHLDRHGDMEGYITAKKHIFDRQRPEDIAVIAVDDSHTRGIAKWMQRDGKRVIEVSNGLLAQGVGVEVSEENATLQENGNSVGDLAGITTLTGRHNWQNAAAAYAATRACGVAPEVIYRAMKSFAGLRHRLQLITSIHGVRFINDSKATNAEATANALAPYDTIYWILGGKAKAGGITSLSEYFPKIAHAFLIGEAEGAFARVLEGKVPFTRSGTLKAAVKQAADQAFGDGRKDAVVLLSPACASFDQWKNFEERGDAFCAMVEALAVGEDGGKAHAL